MAYYLSGIIFYIQLKCDFIFESSLSEAKDKIKSNVLELEREKRKEQLECWRDLMFLKKYLMVSLKDYWELERKRGMLEGNFRND
jgi:hypothetical protein